MTTQYNKSEILSRVGKGRDDYDEREIAIVNQTYRKVIKVIGDITFALTIILGAVHFFSEGNTFLIGMAGTFFDVTCTCAEIEIAAYLIFLAKTKRRRDIILVVTIVVFMLVLFASPFIIDFLIG